MNTEQTDPLTQQHASHQQSVETQNAKRVLPELIPLIRDSDAVSLF